MAQVFLAVQEGIGGFEKLVVVKRIFPELCRDNRFVGMFLAEARLAATVRHPNVVEILDIDQDEEGYFIVMEYLSGETLAFVAQTLSRQNQPIPPHVVCRVGAAVATGLHHAHTATDATGAENPIVHRDVTPSNLILCYNGVVKIVDFGVAKALTGIDDAMGSAITGKSAYLTPEQIQHQQVDVRTDIFQLGIVLHELLTGRRLFNARNDREKLLAVLEREIKPPSTFNSAIPPALDEVVMAALERNPDARPQSADEIRVALDEVLHQLGRAVSDHELGAWMRTAFPDAYAKRVAMERSTAAKVRDSRDLSMPMARPAAAINIDEPPAEALTPTASGQAMRRPGDGMPGSGVPLPTPFYSADLSSRATFVPGAQPNTNKISQVLPPVVQTERSRKTWLYAGVATLFTASIGVAIAVRGGEGETVAATGVPVHSPPQVIDKTSQTTTPVPDSRPDSEIAKKQASETYSVAVKVRPSNATIEFDGAIVGQGSFHVSLERNDIRHVLVVSADGYKPRVLTFSADQPLLEELITLEPLKAGETNDIEPRRRPVQRDTRTAERDVKQAKTPTALPPVEEKKPVEETKPEPTPAEDAPKTDKPRKKPDNWDEPTSDNIDPWSN